MARLEEQLSWSCQLHVTNVLGIHLIREMFCFKVAEILGVGYEQHILLNNLLRKNPSGENNSKKYLIYVSVHWNVAKKTSCLVALFELHYITYNFRTADTGIWEGAEIALYFYS